MDTGFSENLFHEMHSAFPYPHLILLSFLIQGGISEDIDGAAKEWEHELRQNNMDKELNELSKRLEEKEV